MAKAEKKPKENFDVILTLSIEEAETLKKVCGKVSGDRESSRRNHTSSIYKELSDIGINDILEGKGSFTF